MKKRRYFQAKLDQNHREKYRRKSNNAKTSVFLIKTRPELSKNIPSKIEKREKVGRHKKLQPEQAATSKPRRQGTASFTCGVLDFLPLLVLALLEAPLIYGPRIIGKTDIICGDIRNVINY